MKRFFASDAESDMLIAEATKTFGLKIGDIINMAIKNQFLPITEPFRTEARLILQRHTAGELEAQEIKQSMTRGIRALGRARCVMQTACKDFLPGTICMRM